MSTVTPGNLALGPGSLFVGAFGAPEPLPVEINGTPATSAWTDVGGTLGGLSFTITNTWKELDVDQIIEVPERRLTKREVSLKTSLAEVTLTNLTLAMSGGTTVTADTNADEYTPDDVNSGSRLTYKAIIFDGFGGSGLRRRVFVRKVLNTDNTDVQAHPDNQTAYPVTFHSHYVSSAIRSWKVQQAKV
jgi:hypothetical protein